MPRSDILVIAPSWVGDLVMAQALFTLLKKQRPSANIDVMAPAWCAPILLRMPEVRRVIDFPFSHGVWQLKQRKKFALAKQHTAYAQAIVLPNSWKSAWVPYCMKIPTRTGWLGEARFGVLNDWRRLKKAHYPLMVQRYAALALDFSPIPLDNIPYPRLVVSAETVAATCQKHQVAPVGDSPVLALCPGASGGMGKCWPAAYYAQVAKQKIKEGWRVWLLGSPNDQPIISDIITQTEGRAEDLGATVSLEEKIDLLSLVDTVISNDSGLLHVASALDKKVIGLYGPTSPEHAPPLCQQATVLSCYDPAMKKNHLNDPSIIASIMPERVLSAMHARKWRNRKL